MTAKSSEERAAESVLGFDAEGYDRVAAVDTERDEATRRLERDMRETVSALQAWGRHLEAQPARMPKVRPSSSWAWAAGIAAALAIGFGFNFWHMNHGASTAIARELEWTTTAAGLAAESGPVREITVHLTASRSAWQTRPPADFDSAAAQDVRRRAGFAFRMPDRLSGSLTLRAAELAGSNRVHLVYAGDSGSVAVFLSRSPGPDITVREVRIGERTLMAGRRHGVLAAFDASSRPACDWGVLLRDFANGDHGGG